MTASPGPVATVTLGGAPAVTSDWYAAYFTDPKWGMPERFIATTGMPVDEKGVQHGPDLNLACRNALLAMIELLVAERGFTRQQAFAICSVALDLKISNVVDVPNVVVSAFLPEAIFEG